MSATQKFLHLPASEQRLLIQSAILLGGIRVGLRLLPFRTVRSVVARLASAPLRPYRTKRCSTDRLVWAVTKASRYVPEATCLTQALAAEVLLARHGHPADLRVGFVRAERGKLEGHAWLESRGRIVVGGGEVSHYTRLPGMERGSI
ncbi:MAG: lasso peptide biosynthesis B2 protein [Rubrobacter sp.]|nr:lasso peptide biosynthesis B2 protein [Rubrobacter sp.]